MLFRTLARFSNGTRFTNQSTFANDGKIAKSQGQLDSNIEGILNQRRNIRKRIAQIQKQNLPIQQNIRAYMDSIVNITYYMRNDNWESQYMHLLLNYNKLGFRRVSDLVQLDRASYLLDLRNKSDEIRWPAIKVVIALEPKIILSGIKPITQFFKQNGYFNNDYDRHSSEIESLKQFIDKNILSYMESLFWHPKLTIQYSFHTNISSYVDTSRSNIIYGILGRNGAIIISRIVKNLIKIAKENERYCQSKQNFTKNMKEIANVYLKNKPFFGGDKPNHIDFYLMSHLKTKNQSKLFMNFLQKNIGVQFWSWWMRLNNLCQYNPDRVTTI